MAETHHVAVITGASSGLGEVYARKLADRGWNLVLIARRQERLEALKRWLEASHGIEARVLVADLSQPADIARVAAFVREQPRLELLVNNAGFGTKGLFWEVPIEEQRGMHHVHVMATLELSHAALQTFVPADRGAIINVSSVAAFARSTGSANYCATKGWINHISEGIYLDLKSQRSRVKIQALCPGFTYSGFHDAMGVSRDPVPKWLWLQADYVVEESLQALERDQLFVIPSVKYRVIAGVLSKLPSALRVRLGARSPQRSMRMER